MFTVTEKWNHVFCICGFTHIRPRARARARVCVCDRERDRERACALVSARVYRSKQFCLVGDPGLKSWARCLILLDYPKFLELHPLEILLSALLLSKLISVCNFIMINNKNGIRRVASENLTWVLSTDWFWLKNYRSDISSGETGFVSDDCLGFAIPFNRLRWYYLELGKECFRPHHYNLVLFIWRHMMWTKKEVYK